MKSKYSNILLIVVSLALSLFVLEIGFRMAKGRLINSGAYLFAQPGDESWKWWEILRPSDSKELSYEHIPNSEARVFDSVIKINSLGFRDNEYSQVKEAGTYRIIGVGDSIMFGWRVPLDDIYLKILERGLNRAEKTEVINCSIPGYNTRQEYALTEKLAAGLSPDMVIMGFFINDVYDPTYLLWKGKYLVSPKIVEHYENNKNILKHIHRFLINHLKIYDHMVSRIKKKTAERISDNIVLEKENWLKTEELILKTNNLLKERGIRFLVFHVPSQQEISDCKISNPPNEVLSNLCALNNIEYCTAFYKMSKGSDKSSLFIRNDGHLTKKGHIIAAEVLKDYLDHNVKTNRGHL